MKLRHLLIALIMSTGFVRTTPAQQQPDQTGKKAIVTSVKSNLAWYDLQKQLTSVLQGQGWSSEQKGTYFFGDTVKFDFRNLTSFSTSSKSSKYQLFLPLYNHVKWMEIGLPKDAELSWVAPSAELPIVVYGTSIAQGGCASRPGMAWTGILNRELPFPLINLGFSGNGRLEKEVLNFINEIKARLYILDCLPNLVGRPADEIEITDQKLHSSG